MSRGKKKQSNGHRPHKPRPKGPGQWDLLNNTFNALVDYAQLPTQVAGMLRNPEAVAKVEDRPLLVQRAKSLCDDCGTLTKELLDLRSEHEGLRGEPKNPDDHVRCVDLHTRYVDWAERYEAVVYPTYLAISEQIGKGVGVDIMANMPTDVIPKSE